MAGPIDNQKTDIVNQSIEYPRNILEFQKMFPNEMACLKYLEHMRWPNGFTCSKCSEVGEPFRISKRLRVLICKFCRYETSVTAGTVMHRSKTDILVWFWATHLVSASVTKRSNGYLLKSILNIFFFFFFGICYWNKWNIINNIFS